MKLLNSWLNKFSFLLFTFLRSRYWASRANDSTANGRHGSARKQIQQDILAEESNRTTHTMSTNNHDDHGLPVSTYKYRSTIKKIQYWRRSLWKRMKKNQTLECCVKCKNSAGHISNGKKRSRKVINWSWSSFVYIIILGRFAMTLQQSLL